MAMKALPSQKFLRQCFDYDPSIGTLTWRVRPRKHFSTDRAQMLFNARHAGNVITSRCGQHGYLGVRFKGWGILRAHRLIWRWMTGDDPPTELDHKNGNKLDNKWANLRLATPHQSQGNKKIQSNNSVGLKGVKKRGKKFRAVIGKRYLGTFATPQEAHEAYWRAAQKLFGEFACDGTRE